LVTGASSGIGRGIAVALGAAGARVVGVARNEQGLAETRALIGAAGGTATSYVADLAEPTAGHRAVDAVMEAHGRLDILVNAAGVQRRRPAFEVTEEDWDAMLAVNLKSLFFLSQAAARRMAERRSGAIINITSLTSVIGIPELSVHGAIKGAVTQLTKALAVEWATVGIRVNAIGPGRIRTPMTEPVFSDPAVRERFVSLIPMGRGGTPEDLAGAAVFLASDASAYVTGQTIYVDGGWLAGGGSPSR
jgi:NAD(P)-dependent dehydrogenase (short-subunit alcohol dehydrogenase family)